MAIGVGVFRNRTPKYLQLRQNVRSAAPYGASAPGTLVGSEGAGLLGSANVPSDAPGAGVSQPANEKTPLWVEIVERVKSDLAVAKSKMTELEQLHQKHLLVGFGDRKQEEQQIEIVTREITRLFTKTQTKVKAVALLAPDEVKLPPEEIQTRKNVQVSLAMQLQELSLDFRRNQKSYLTQLKALEERGEAKLRGYIDSGYDDARAPTAAQVQAMDTGFSAEQLAWVDTEEAVVRDREREIDQIQKAVEDLNSLMRDLNQLVIDQGSMLDRIDYNLEQAAQYTEDAVGEVQKAEKHQKALRCQICVVLLVLLVAGAAIGLVVKFVPRHSSPTPTESPEPTTTPSTSPAP